MRQHDVLLGRLDVLLRLCLIRREIVERAAHARECHRRIGKTLFHLGALRLAQRDLHAVLVRRAQFHPSNFASVRFLMIVGTSQSIARL